MVLKDLDQVQPKGKITKKLKKIFAISFYKIKDYICWQKCLTHSSLLQNKNFLFKFVLGLSHHWTDPAMKDCKGSITDVMLCLMCMMENEFLIHFMRDCCHATSLWSYVIPFSINAFFFPLGDVQQWMLLNLGRWIYSYKLAVQIWVDARFILAEEECLSFSRSKVEE